MFWVRSNKKGTGGSGGLVATEIIVTTAQYTSEPLPEEQEET